MLKKILAGFGYVAALLVMVNSGHGLVMWHQENKVIAVVERTMARDPRLSSYHVFRCFQLHRDGWLCDARVTFTDGSTQELSMVPVPDSAIR